MMPLADAARELGVAPVTLKRWRKLGCPCVPGRRGRGHAALYDPEAIRTWRAAHGREALALEMGAVLPGVMADAVFDAWRELEGPTKREKAGPMALALYACATAALDHLRAENASVPQFRAPFPEHFEYLRKIAAG